MKFPQLMHVLSGQMSIVGPRPVTPEIEKHLIMTI